ncbi:MAG: aminoacyl-histidine dipeptidase [Bacteroidetes bacterium]|nr:aminoacyl-histidine dipeptidase [Bacteroidota bacterium]
MSEAVRNLEPKEMWNNFADLNAVPRPSKKEEKVIEFIKNFGEGLGLPTTVDEVGNVIIKKPATPGMEDKTTIVMQSHLDMVHQKNADTDFDFATQGIDMVVDGDWVKANGTTLGSDNGIGVASIMTILASSEIEHPALEALFTIDEETGMTGALGLKGGLLEGKILLNLDTEDDDELTIGCAGGIDITAIGKYEEEAPSSDQKGFKLILKGLAGGHSGMEIHLGKGNSNKLMNRLLVQAASKYDLRVSSVDGGGLRNAIPRESFAEFVVPEDQVTDLSNWIKEQEAILKDEHRTYDPDMVLILEPIDLPAKILNSEFQGKILRSIYSCPNGIYRMSPEIKDLVQTSNNVARVIIKDGEYSIQCLTRSSVDSEKADLAFSIQSAFELSGAEIVYGGSYPGWAPMPDAAIVKILGDLYKEMYDDEAQVMACHAGLECGIIGTNYPDMEMISFGPNIRGAHSPDEKVQISSVQKYWKFLMETLKRIPAKN